MVNFSPDSLVSLIYTGNMSLKDERSTHRLVALYN